MHHKSLYPWLTDKSLLITGGTGSFGTACVRHLLNVSNVGRLCIYSRDEFKQSQQAEAFNDLRLRYFLGDVRDHSRLLRACQGVDYIIHAAALKQVPALEYNPAEAVKTNVVGTMNVIEACLTNGVQRAVLLSTDKSSAPSTLYGATKLTAERLWVAANAYTGAHGRPTFLAARYGNVAGSRGSVIPRWRTIPPKGPVPLTAKDMTRFWIAIEEAVWFTLHWMGHGQAGAVYVPKIPSFRLTDLAKAMGRETVVIGLRGQEKLHESMVSPDEFAHECADHWVLDAKTGKLGHQYRSDQNGHWLEVGDLRERLKHV